MEEAVITNMCLYPELIKNPKYKPNKKNGGKPPLLLDKRLEYVPRACGKCMECMKAKSREWQVRLLEHIKTNKNGKFITLTFSNEAIAYINNLIDEEEAQLLIDFKTEGYERDNRIATKAVRRFLERWRKKYKVSPMHWLITELGHQGTKNIHIHGIIWTDEPIEEVEKIWKSGEDGGGYVWLGNRQKNSDKLYNYVNEKTINYITKYVTKIDHENKYYKPKILTSKGIGKDYLKTFNSKINQFKEGNTKEYYITRTGHKLKLPMYLRNKLYNDEEKEKLWLEKLDKQVRWVNGTKIDIKDGEEDYYKYLKHVQQINKEIGYGDNSENWELKEYEKQRRNLLRQERINKTGLAVLTSKDRLPPESIND